MQGYVHPGFLNNLLRTDNGQQVWEVIGDAVRSVMAAEPDLDLWITGHSLGAGLAVLAAALYINDPIAQLPLRRVAAFGVPVVGNVVFVRTLTQTLFVSGTTCAFYVNERDCIPRLQKLSLIPDRWQEYPQQWLRPLPSRGPGPVDLSLHLPSDMLPRAVDKVTWGVGVYHLLPRGLYSHLPSEYIRDL